MGGMMSTLKNRRKARRPLENEPSSQVVCESTYANQSQNTNSRNALTPSQHSAPQSVNSSPKPPRHHPYDEVNEDQIEANRLAAAMTVQQSSGSGKEQTTPSSRIQSENTYNNVIINQDGDLYTKINKPKKCDIETTKYSDDVYMNADVSQSQGINSKPDQSEQASIRMTNSTPADPTLHYIEVEVVPLDPSKSSEFKRQPSHPPCTYTDVIPGNGHVKVLGD